MNRFFSCVFVFTMPRSCEQLLAKLLRTQKSTAATPARWENSWKTSFASSNSRTKLSCELESSDHVEKVMCSFCSVWFVKVRRHRCLFCIMWHGTVNAWIDCCNRWFCTLNASATPTCSAPSTIHMIVPCIHKPACTFMRSHAAHPCRNWRHNNRA